MLCKACDKSAITTEPIMQINTITHKIKIMTSKYLTVRNLR